MNGRTVMRLTTLTRPKNIYNLSRQLPTENPRLKAGRVIMLSFEAKTEVASLETGEGKLLCLLKQSPSFKTNLSRTVSIGNTWRRYYFPFTLTTDVPADGLALVFQFGYPEQEVLVRSTQLMLHPEGTKADNLPQTSLTYDGRGTDAAWRDAAAKRIERHRKGSYSLRVLDDDGKPRTDVEVRIKLTRHHFGWGAAVNAQKIAAEPERLNRIAGLFNTVVFENDLKIKRWGNENSQATTIGVMDQLKARNIDVKGHVLIWPGLRYLSEEVRRAKGNPEKTTRINARARRRCAKNDGGKDQPLGCGQRSVQ